MTRLLIDMKVANSIIATWKRNVGRNLAIMLFATSIRSLRLSGNDNDDDNVAHLTELMDCSLLNLEIFVLNMQQLFVYFGKIVVLDELQINFQITYITGHYNPSVRISA